MLNQSCLRHIESWAVCIRADIIVSNLNLSWVGLAFANKQLTCSHNLSCTHTWLGDKWPVGPKVNKKPPLLSQWGVKDKHWKEIRKYEEWQQQTMGNKKVNAERFLSIRFPLLACNILYRKKDTLYWWYLQLSANNIQDIISYCFSFLLYHIQPFISYGLLGGTPWTQTIF